MGKKIFFLLVIFISSVFLFSDNASAGSCGSSRQGTCRTTCSIGENAITDPNNDCSLSEICCSNGGSVVTDCTTTGCPTGQECTGIFSKTCEPIASAADQSNTQTPATTQTPTPTQVQAQAPTQMATSAGGGWNINNIAGFGLPQASLTQITGNLLNWILGILAVVGVIGFVISGILYLVSTGDETMLERAKAAMKWSIVGVIVGLSGVVIIQAVDWALNGFGWF